MTLRLHKVTKQIDRLRESAVARAGKRQADLPKVRQAWERAGKREDLKVKARKEAERGYNGAMPSCGETVSFTKAAPAAPAAHQTLQQRLPFSRWTLLLLLAHRPIRLQSPVDFQEPLPGYVREVVVVDQHAPLLWI